MLNSGLQIRIAAPAMDLGPTGNTGFDKVLFHITRDFVLELLNKFGAFGAGAHN